MGMVLRVVPVLVLALLALMVPRNSVAAAPARKYDCTKLITDAEMQTATGLSSAALARQRFGTDSGEPAELTSCQFSAQGAISIGLTVATGAAVALYEAAVFSAPTGGREALPGIGDDAVFIPLGKAAGARAHGVVIVVKFQAHRTNALGDVDVKGASPGSSSWRSDESEAGNAGAMARRPHSLEMSMGRGVCEWLGWPLPGVVAAPRLTGRRGRA